MKSLNLTQTGDHCFPKVRNMYLFANNSVRKMVHKVTVGSAS